MDFKKELKSLSKQELRIKKINFVRMEKKYMLYKSILDAKPTEQEWEKLFTSVKAYNHYTKDNYLSIITWQARRYMHLAWLFALRGDREEARFFCDKSFGRIKD